MKIFDFEQALKQGRNPQVVNFFRENWNKKITEEEFIETMQKLRIHRLGDSKKYSPSHLKKEYKNLKEQFGFFKS